MHKKNTLEYLSKLLNQPITEEVSITLSSAQKARMHGWLVNNGILFNESVLSHNFTATQLLNGVASGELTQPFSKSSYSSLGSCGSGSNQIGLDIQRVDELFPKGLPCDPKADGELTQIFTIKELSYAQSKSEPDITLTGIYCAKEAIKKASNSAKNFNEIEVLPDESGKPRSKGYELSISHSGNYAIAVAYYSNIDSQNLPQDDFILDGENDRGNKNQEIKNISRMGLRAFDYVLVVFVAIALLLAIVKI